MTTRSIFLAVVLLAACRGRAPSHEHATEHPEGHDHHAEGHGHGDEAVERVTVWGDTLQLFAEHPHALVGSATPFLAHVTVNDGHRAVKDGKMTLRLEGPVVVEATADKPVRPGTFAITFTLSQPGSYKGTLTVEGATPGTITGFTVEAHAKAEHGDHEPEVEEPGDHIEFLMEQQWGVPFGTAFAAQEEIQPVIEVSGRVDTPPGGSAEVGAPIAGRLMAPPGGLPRPGIVVRKGQLLATLAPAPSSPEEAARARLAVTEAEARLTAARAAHARAERLVADEAMPRKELEDAAREARVAEQAVEAARSAAQMFAEATSGGGAESWRLTSPIAGTLVSVDATPGASVSGGDVLFRIVDTRELWIVARVPEQDAANLHTERDAAYRIAGLETWLPLSVQGNDATASVISVGRTVDPRSRTVEVIYGLRKPDERLRVGGLVHVSVPVGERYQGVAVPREAIVDDGSRELVYVQVDGEHFEERTVRTGARAASLVAIVDGLEAGERIVVRGAHLVRLAARAATTQPHGHIH